MLTPNHISPTSERRPLHLACLCVAVALLGCDPEREDDAVVREQAAVDCEGTPMVDGGMASLDAGTDDALDAGSELADADAGEGDAEVDGGGLMDPVKPTSSVRIVKLIGNGSGCPLGTINTVFQPPGELPFGAEFTGLEINLAPNKSLDSKFCQLAMELIAPPGFSYAVSDIRFEGHAALEAGASVNLNALYYFSGVPQLPAGPPKTLSGPFDDSFEFRQRVTTFDTNAWSPCGAKRDLNVRITMSTTNKSGATGYVGVGKLMVLELATRKCQ
jgi:hypothetical protein